jgi:hypothetical protein
MKSFRWLALTGALGLLAAGAAPAQIPGQSGGIGEPGQPAPPPDRPAPPARPPVRPPAADRDPLIDELLRKANAGESEGNFCARVSWPPGNSTTYVAWLEAAVVGSTKANTFKGGVDCQFDRVTQVFQQNGRKCVRYTWHACQRGKNCGIGNAVACKQPNGNWDTKG